jgi:hypothetical protein
MKEAGSTGVGSRPLKIGIGAPLAGSGADLGRGGRGQHHGCVPQTRDQRGDLLQVEGQVRRSGCRRHSG